VLEKASATRRLMVITDISDFGKHRRQRVKYLAGQSRRVAEVAVFVGESAAYGRRRAIEAGMPAENVHAFSSIQAAAEFLRSELRPGDLMLLKGRTTDHVTRIFFAQLGPVGCWKEYCPKRMLCDICWELEVSPEQLRKAVVVHSPASGAVAATATLGSSSS
jgi:UDP-N-acetylmuramoyl-tripeptide--D-alanyl-D-alanine ligase